MAEHLRRRIEELKSRKATTEDSVACSFSTTAPASVLTVPTAATAAVGPSSCSPPVLTTSSGKASASIPISNLPPAFVSPHGAVVKYRDAERDPLCASFTTRHAVRLLEAVLQFQKGQTTRKRERCPDVGNDSDETQKRRERQEEQSDGDCIVETKNTNNEEHLSNNDHRTSTIVSYFLPKVADRCFTSSEETGLRVERTDKSTLSCSYRAPTGGIGIRRNDPGHILVSGKRRLPCRSVEEYEPRARIAQGVYGVVISAVETPPVSGGTSDSSNEQVKYALKQVKKQWLEESRIGFPPYLLREFDLLLRLRHPNIVRAREVVIQEKRHGTTKQTRVTIGGVEGGEGGMDLHIVKDAVSVQEMTDFVPTDKNANKVMNGNCTSNNNDNSNVRNNEKSNGIIVSNQERMSPCGVRSRHQGTEEWKTVYLVMEYCPYDLKSFLSLHNEKGVYLHLSSRNKHPDARRNFLSRVKCIMQELFQALSFLHEHRILHRDIKTSNILISSQGIAKLCDFGLGRLYTEGQELTANVVTLIYRAPELHFGIRDYSHKMDVWSLGCIMAELFLKLPLFHAEEEIKHFASVCDVIGIPTEETFSGLYKLPELARMMRTLTRFNRENTLFQVFQKSRHAGASTLPESGFDLLQRILRWNPLDRISAAEALEHPFFHEEPLACEPAELLRPMPSAIAPTSISASMGDEKRDADSVRLQGNLVGEAALEQQHPSLPLQKAESVCVYEGDAIPQCTSSTTTTTTTTTTIRSICGNSGPTIGTDSYLSEEKPEDVLSGKLRPPHEAGRSDDVKDAHRLEMQNGMDQVNQSSGYNSPSEY